MNHPLPGLRPSVRLYCFCNFLANTSNAHHALFILYRLHYFATLQCEHISPDVYFASSAIGYDAGLLPGLYPHAPPARLDTPTSAGHILWDLPLRTYAEQQHYHSKLTTLYHAM